MTLLVGAGKNCLECELAGLVGLEADDQHLVGEATEDLAAIVHAFQPVPDRSDGPIQIQHALVVLDPIVAGEPELEVHEGLVGKLVQRDAHEVLCRQGFGRMLLPIEEQAADLGEVGHGPLVSIVVRCAGPDRILVDLQSLLGRSAEDHCAQAAIADWQGLIPGPGGRIVAQAQRCVAALCHGDGTEAEQGKNGHGRADSQVIHLGATSAGK